MKRTFIANLIPGMVTGEDVYSYSNQLIVSKGTVLTDKIITRLEFYSVPSIRIMENEVQEPTISDPYSARIQASPEFHKFKETFDTTIVDFKDQINDIVEKGAPIDVSSMLDDTLKLLQADGENVNFFNMLHNMRAYDDLTYAHCLNVALICNVFAGWLHFSQEDIELATLCGLFHDIGKLCIPDSIIKKPDRLTNEEYDVIKTHTIEGYKILQNQPVNDHIKNAALMHHERCDGSGYPFGLTGNRIDKFAKIVSIADVYDAMTAARVYRGPLCPFTVIDIFEKEGLQKYESEYILCFLKNVVLTYIGQRVRLTNGQEGDVVFINPQQLSRPMVKCGDTFVDLSKQKDIAIERLL